MKFHTYAQSFALAALLSFPLMAASPSSDFLIIESPASCALYDQYEQLLSDSKKNSLPPNAPFEIINERQLMGDQITQAMQLNLLGSVYYLILDEKGNVTGVPGSAGSKRYRGCTPRNDSLMVTVSALSLMRQPVSGGTFVTLKRGDTVLRIFSWRGSNYLLYSKQKQIFGWTGSTKKQLRAIESKHTVHSSENDFSPLHLRIMKRLKEANDRYDSLFSYFNTRTRQEKAVPRWIAEATGDHRYVLKGSDEVVGVLENSTRYIVKDIEQ
ncbi:MAG: hypothetical protein JW863_07240, partial [Chitinispirillaceae bacterium]|nr:hypothetical protein [Chitinispirillaceae bacterium]